MEKQFLGNKEVMIINNNQYIIQYIMNGIEWYWQGRKVIGTYKPDAITCIKPIRGRFKTKDELIEYLEAQ